MHGIRRVDLGIFVLGAVCLLAIWPLVSQPGLPRETDAELHIFRTVELHHLIRHGAIYPRWAPDFYFGYGYPILNYYAPLVYYVGALIMLLTGAGAVLAVKAVFCLAVLGAGGGMYLFVRRMWGTRPGLLAAAAYLYAPYVQFVDPFARGVLAESMSLALFPWVLWAFTPAPGRTVPGVKRILVESLLLAAMLCSHNLLAPMLLVMLVVWLAWREIGRLRSTPQTFSRHETASNLLRTLTPVALGVAMASFFWLPVILERGAVQLGNVVSTGGHFDYRSHFLSMRELLSPSLRIDQGATAPVFRFNLGVAQWILGLAAAVWVVAKRGRNRTGPDGLFWGVLAGLLALMMLPWADPIWNRIPGFRYMQFPWRLLGPAAACLAVAAGSLAREIEGRRGYAGWIAALLGLVLLLALPLSFWSGWEPMVRADISVVHERELGGWWLGTTSTGDYLPVSVLSVPRPEEEMGRAYLSGMPVDRVNRVTLPAGTTVYQVEDRPLVWTYQIVGDQAFVFRLYQFVFPGWTATMDGVPVAIEPGMPEGFITISVPAGSHTLRVAFRDTPARTVGWVVSGTALLLAAALSVAAGWRRRRRLCGDNSEPGATRVDHRPVCRTRDLVILCLGPALILTARVVSIGSPMGLYYRSTGLTAEPAQHPVFHRLGDWFALLGFDSTTPRGGRETRVTLYWKALTPVPDRYQVFVHLRDEAGQVAAQSDKLNPGDYPTTRWPTDRYVRDVHRLSVPTDLAAGRYRLAVGLWNMAVGNRLPTYDAQGNELGDSVFLAEWVVGPDGIIDVQ
jgi:hypothetical protein